ncbi:MAG: ISAs1 family transposase [Chitinophagaceae bacterium]|nr:MAG: ISAs1 family transposase [Chitinophagaceae bacterium]
MAKSIVTFFEKIPDRRRGAGQRHNQTLILVLVLMSTMSGCFGYRATGDFIRRNHEALCKYLKPRKGRLPSFDTVRRVMMGIDFCALSAQFKAWAAQYVVLEKGEWIAVDGKALSGTAIVQSPQQKQAFVSLVSVYCSKQNLVLANDALQNSKQSEIPLVQSLLAALHLEGVVFTLDALHCQKKRQPLSGNPTVIMSLA